MTKYKVGDKVFYRNGGFSSGFPCIGYGTVVEARLVRDGNEPVYVLCYIITDEDSGISTFNHEAEVFDDPAEVTKYMQDLYEKAKAGLEEVYRKSKECVERNS